MLCVSCIWKIKKKSNDDDARWKGITLAPSSLRIGMLVPKDNLADIVRLNLREALWTKLATGIVSGGWFFVHFGWDFYMFIGSTSPSIEAIKSAESNGLFVEPMRSPYLKSWE